MKVGIFGDSFAAASGWNDWFQNPHIKSWSYYLRAFSDVAWWNS